uniref:Ribonucleotide reductase inhibitor n=1 Tax=Colletotrichum fructicola (strain Nara gc5) TaxID=1213859 RepID=L2FWR4_COLFN
MASKRSRDTSDADADRAPKRSKKPREHQNAHIDPTWGQKYVFSATESATTVPVDPELDFEDDGDAMAYLKSVRTQANGIPHLLVAPKIPIGPQLPKELQNTQDGEEEPEEGEDVEEDREIYTSGQGDFRGYYHDGAYTARPANWEEANDTGTHELGDHGHFVGAFGPKSSTFSVWSQRLRTSDPMPAQVASMDKDGVLRVIRVLLGGKFLRRGLADMARLRDALEEEGMDLGVHDAVDESSDDEDVMREMEVEERNGEAPAPDSESKAPPEESQGEDAESHKLAEQGEVEDGEVDDDQKSEPMDVSEDGEVDEGEVAEESAPAETLEEARARLLARLDTTATDEPAEAAEKAESDDEDMSDQLRARMNMRATLNMILTVAGEFYGQRDLLEFRDPFTGM